PSTLYHPARDSISNACGVWGARAAHLVFSTLGLAGYYAVLSLAVLDVQLLLRRPITAPSLRMVVWLLSLWGLATLVAMALAGYSTGPVIGPGGYIGAAGRGLLEAHFASAGAYILVLSLILGGLLLCTDYVLLRILGFVLGVPAKGVARALARSMLRWQPASSGAETSAAGKRRRGKSDLDAPLTLDADEEAEDEEDEE